MSSSELAPVPVPENEPANPMPEHVYRRFQNAPPYHGVYGRGYAVGQSDIVNDAIDFRYFEETWKVPARDAMTVAKWNGYFYEVPIELLREIVKGLHA